MRDAADHFREFYKGLSIDFPEHANELGILQEYIPLILDLGLRDAKDREDVRDSCIAQLVDTIAGDNFDLKDKIYEKCADQFPEETFLGNHKSDSLLDLFNRQKEKKIRWKFRESDISDLLTSEIKKKENKEIQSKLETILIFTKELFKKGYSFSYLSSQNPPGDRGSIVLLLSNLFFQPQEKREEKWIKTEEGESKFYYLPNGSKHVVAKIIEGEARELSNKDDLEYLTAKQKEAEKDTLSRIEYWQDMSNVLKGLEHVNTLTKDELSSNIETVQDKITVVRPLFNISQFVSLRTENEKEHDLILSICIQLTHLLMSEKTSETTSPSALTEEDARKLKLLEDMSVDELQNLLSKKEILGDTPKEELLSLVETYRKYQEQIIKGEVRVISPTAFNRERQNIFDQTLQGIRFIIERKGKRLAVLSPYARIEEDNQTNLSQEEQDKLGLIRDYSADELKTMVNILEAKLSLADLIKANKNS